MSITINSSPAHGVGYGPAYTPQDSQATAAPINAFAAYAAPGASSDTAPVIGQGAIPIPPPLARHAASTVPSAETARLQANVELLKSAKMEVRNLADRLQDDPTLAMKPGKTTRTLASALDFVVAETKKSGLYGNLQQAAIQRLKDSGNYESLVGQILEKEQANGRPRDRAWAESWIHNQYDYDRINQSYVADAPYFEPAHPYSGDVMRSPFNRGNAMFYGDSTGAQAQGSFAVSISENDGNLTYQVRNLETGVASAPRPYDPKGTVVKEDGLYAELLGTPAPGDEFIISQPAGERRDEAKMRVDYYDADYRQYSNMDVNVRKTEVFNTLFNPVFHGGGIPQPSDLIQGAIS